MSRRCSPTKIFSMAGLGKGRMCAAGLLQRSWMAAGVLGRHADARLRGSWRGLNGGGTRHKKSGAVLDAAQTSGESAMSALIENAPL
jgi:hypothetical protein